jgi:hypothetical protein
MLLKDDLLEVLAKRRAVSRANAALVAHQALCDGVEGVKEKNLQGACHGGRPSMPAEKT